MLFAAFGYPGFPLCCTFHCHCTQDCRRAQDWTATQLGSRVKMLDIDYSEWG
jgi:hypothetical protein